MTARLGETFILFQEGPASCGAAPRPGAASPSEGRYLVVPSSGAVGVIEAIRALGARARAYRVVPVIEVEADPGLVPAIRSLPGIELMLPALGALDSSRTFANGIDVLLQIALTQHGATDAEPLFPGRASGDALGYPVHSRERGIELDTGLDLAAPPALLPVINLSAGPASPEFPFVLNDVVNHATAAGGLAEALLVLAAGNCGTRGQGSMSAWARAPWVLSVGATVDETGAELAPYSAVGEADDPESGPDLVADGRSYVPPHPEGTSFAAPKVTFLARLVVAALCELGAEVRAQATGVPQGVPLVGCGIVDRFGSGIWENPVELVPLAALPLIGIDRAAVSELLGIARGAGAVIDVRGTPDLVRSLLLEAARPMPGYAPHEVGAGFIDQEGVLDRLAAFTGDEVLRRFGGGAALPGDGSGLALLRVFDLDGLRRLARIVQATGPQFAYDYAGQRIAARPVHPDDRRTLPMFERTLGVAAGPLDCR